MAREQGKQTDPPPEDADPGRNDAGFMPDLMRRAFALGLSGFFTTEEALRRAVGDTLPRDWVDFAASQGERTRAEMAERLAGEFGRVLENVDLAELARAVLQGQSVEVTARIRLVPRDEDPDR